MKKLLVPAFLLALFCLAFPGRLQAEGTTGGLRSFSQFEMLLPPGWDGDEQSGFITDKREEYVISVARKDEAEDRYTAQLSIYLLPNPAGYDTKKAAEILAQSQVDSTEPVAEGEFYTFQGEPRTTIVHGLATTRVRVNPERMLIIIAQDPGGQEAEEIFASLRGLSPEARELLGR